MIEDVPGEAPASEPEPTPIARTREAIIDAMMAPRRSGEREVKVEPEPTQAGGEPAAETEETPPVETPPEPPIEKKDNGRLAQALVQAEQEKARTLKLDKRVKELEATIAEAKGDKLKALALAGYDPEKLVQEMLEGKTKPKEPEQTPEQKLVAEMKSQVEELRRERDESKAEATKRQEVALIQDAIKDSDIAGVYPWAVDAIHRKFYDIHRETGEVPALADVVKDVEAGIASDLRLALSSERAVKSLLADPKTREMVVKALGLQQTTPATEKVQPTRQENPRVSPPADGPQVITNRMAAEVPVRSAQEKPLSDTDRKERSISILLQNKKVGAK